MKKKLPIVFVNEIKKKLENNKKIFYSGHFVKEEINKRNNDRIGNNIDIDEKIREMFDSPFYVYKISATLLTKEGKKIKKDLIGRIDDKLVTIDEEYILIDDIKDIEY